MGLPLHRLFFAHRDPARLSSFLRRPLPIFAQALSPKRQTGTMEHPSHTLGRSTTDHSEPPHYSVNTQSGVGKAEALQNPKVWGKWSTGALFIGVGIMAYMYSLDGVTTWVYTSYATSSFLQHSLLGAVGTVSAIVIAVGKPVSAKISDVIGRAEAWIIGSAGYAAVQILMQIIIGDVTTLRWRTLSSSLVSAPYFVNGFVGSKIAASVYEESGWRWGYGMFAILFPACAIPIVATLAWSQWKAYKLGLVHTSNPFEETQLKEQVAKRPILARIMAVCIEMDAIGLLLFTAGWTLLLLPLTIANKGSLPWSSGKIIAMLTLGPIFLILFTFYEAKYAKYPIIPARFLFNRTVLAAGLIGFFDFVSFYLQYTYQYSFIYVVKPWSLVDQNYFAQTQTIALTLFGIIAGAIVFKLRRYKWLLFGGLLVRLFGVGLMIHSKGANGTTAELVIVQVLQGMGGGFAAVLCQTAAQAAVAHQDLAAVTAFVLLLAEIGNAIGTAIATAIWRDVMPGALQSRLEGLAGVDQATIDGIYANIVGAALYPIDDPIRVNTILAYEHTMMILLIVATVVAVIPPFLVLMMKDIRFGDQQNDVERRAPDGESLTSYDLDSDKK